jgi:hypothetical protein
LWSLPFPSLQELGQAKKQSGEESATKSVPRRIVGSASTSSLNSSGLSTPATKR